MPSSWIPPRRGRTADAADTRRRHQPPAGPRPAPSNTVARTANSPGMLAWSLAFWSTVTNDYQPRAPHPRRNAEATGRSPRLGNILQQVRKPWRRVAASTNGAIAGRATSSATPRPRSSAGSAMLHVRYGKAKKGSPPKRRSVLTVFDWTPEVIADWLAHGQPCMDRRA